SSQGQGPGSSQGQGRCLGLLCLFDKRDVIHRLLQRFKVKGIPSLVVGSKGLPCVVILNMAGNLISCRGRSVLSADPRGENFPWEKPFAAVLGESLRKGDACVGPEVTNGKTLGFYFAAADYDTFTLKLAERYKTYKAKGLPFEIICCAPNVEESQFNSRFKEMATAGGDWLAVPWSDFERREHLSLTFWCLEPSLSCDCQRERPCTQQQCLGCDHKRPHREGFPLGYNDYYNNNSSSNNNNNSSNNNSNNKLC
ncbi:unnamed protein product, partial [Polarella glacialis]